MNCLVGRFLCFLSPGNELAAATRKMSDPPKEAPSWYCKFIVDCHHRRHSSSYFIQRTWPICCRREGDLHGHVNLHRRTQKSRVWITEKLSLVSLPTDTRNNNSLQI